MAQKNHLQNIVIWGRIRVLPFSHETLLRLLCEEYISHDNATMQIYHAAMTRFVRGTCDEFDELSSHFTDHNGINWTGNLYRSTPTRYNWNFVQFL